MENEIRSLLQESILVKEKILQSEYLVDQIGQVALKIEQAYRDSKKVIIFGNGGSAADAQHIAGEFVGRFYKERSALPALALNANSSILTALGNDYGYESVFKRQVEANTQPGDVVIGITTSGNSPNVVEALKLAKQMGAVTIGWTGEKKSRTSEIADICLQVPSRDTPRIQEGHITIGHIICYLVEKALFPD